MKLLLTNDDGIYSIGIQTMAKRLADAGHELLLVAPDRERSGTGHAMTLDRPLFLRDADKRLFTGGYPAKMCDGMPTDCVIMGIDVLGFEPDVVISGINQGPNLGDDITYSGTVCAAMEGVIAGFPSIALSLVMSSKDKSAHNETAADVLMSLLGWIKDDPIPRGVFYNINVPNLPTGELKGIRLTTKGVRRYRDKITVVRSPFGEERYWLGGHIEDDMSEGTDVQAVSLGYVSITPLHMDMTNFEAYENCKKNGMEETLAAKLKM